MFGKLILKTSLILNFLKLFVFIGFIFPSLSFGSEEPLNKNLTNLIRPNWPYEAFLAIPRISEMRPTLGIEISEDNQRILSSNCIELMYFDLQKEFEPELLLDRKSLHHLLCKAMRRAIKKTPEISILKFFQQSNSFALSFDFFEGKIEVVEIPYPPLSPLLKLENVFLDETEVLNFGGIDFPEELEVEINQAPL